MRGPLSARKQTLANRISEATRFTSGYRSEADIVSAGPMRIRGPGRWVLGYRRCGAAWPISRAHDHGNRCHHRCAWDSGHRLRKFLNEGYQPACGGSAVVQVVTVPHVAHTLHQEASYGAIQWTVQAAVAVVQGAGHARHLRHLSRVGAGAASKATIGNPCRCAVVHDAHAARSDSPPPSTLRLTGASCTTAKWPSGRQLRLPRHPPPD